MSCIRTEIALLVNAVSRAANVFLLSCCLGSVLLRSGLRARLLVKEEVESILGCAVYVSIRSSVQRVKGLFVMVDKVLVVFYFWSKQLRLLIFLQCTQMRLR